MRHRLVIVMEGTAEELIEKSKRLKGVGDKAEWLFECIRETVEVDPNIDRNKFYLAGRAGEFHLRAYYLPDEESVASTEPIPSEPVDENPAPVEQA